MEEIGPPPESWLRIRELLFPYTHRKTIEAQEKSTRFVHYTSAMVAASIIERHEIWMRNAATMNDFMEVDYGLAKLATAYKKNEKSFSKAVDVVFPGASKRLEDAFDKLQPLLRRHTFLTCFSEHDESEDEYGRLSMWRAYGGSTGVGLVIKPDVFFSQSTALGVYASPVLYADQPAVDRLIEEIQENLVEGRDYLRGLGEDGFVGTLSVVFTFAALCTKHPGFSEEKEWRALYMPYQQASTLLKRTTECVRGTLQQVYRVPLKDIPEDGLIGLNPDALLDRLIIGPTEHPITMADAFVDLMRRSEIKNPEKRVFVSEIPLRQF